MNFAKRSVLAVALALLGAVAGSPEAVGQADAPRDTPEARRAEFLARSPLKEAPPPAGAVLHSGGGSDGADHDEWKVRIDTDLSAAEVLEHYRAVFRERGWSFGAVAVDGNVALVSGRTAEKRERHVLLMAARGVVQPERVELMLRLTNLVQP
jgi:hypothetical protein